MRPYQLRMLRFLCSLNLFIVVLVFASCGAVVTPDSSPTSSALSPTIPAKTATTQSGSLITPSPGISANPSSSQLCRHQA